LTGGSRRASTGHETVLPRDEIAEVSWPARAWAVVRLAILAAGVGWLGHLGWKDAHALLRIQPLGIDFMPMWAAGGLAFAHPQRVYDAYGLTLALRPLLAHFHGLRPFVYPPTALLLLAPFALAPFAVANALWTGAGAALIFGAAAAGLRTLRLPVLAAMALTPASVLVAVTGQTTFLIAGLALAGVFALKRRPILAGVLFGLAGAVKPPAMLLLPVALVAAGQWRALAAAAVTAALAVLISALCFGVQIWFDWLAALAHFDAWVMGFAALRRGMITPAALGIWLGLAPGQLLAWRLGFTAAGVAIAWHVFRVSDDPARRLAALLGGALLVTPYAMHYDAALLAPALALMLSRRAAPVPWIIAAAAGALVSCAAIPHWGAAGVIGAVLLASLTSEATLAAPLRAPRLRLRPRRAVAG